MFSIKVNCQQYPSIYIRYKFDYPFNVNAVYNDIYQLLSDKLDDLSYDTKLIQGEDLCITQVTTFIQNNIEFNPKLKEFLEQCKSLEYLSIKPKNYFLT